MTFDPAALAPLAASLARAGLPVLSQILSVAAPFPFNLFVGPATSAILAMLGVDPAAPDAAAQASAKVDSDPTAAAKLQDIEAEHATAVEAAQAELEARLKDVQDARASEVAYVNAKSPMQWGPVAISMVIILGYALACVFPLPPGAQNAGMYETIKLLVVMVASFWLGSSSGSDGKTQTLSKIAMGATLPSKRVGR